MEGLIEGKGIVVLSRVVSDEIRSLGRFKETDVFLSFGLLKLY